MSQFRKFVNKIAYELILASTQSLLFPQITLKISAVSFRKLFRPQYIVNKIAYELMLASTHRVHYFPKSP